MAKHALMKPESNATKIPLGKLKSATAFFFSSSDSEALFIPPAMPIMVMPTSVTMIPIITADVSFSPCPVNTGPSKVPSPAHVPRARDCPNATPRYRMERPNVSPPIPHSIPKKTAIRLSCTCEVKRFTSDSPAGAVSMAPSKGNKT